jgi:hypothetical protein
MAEIFKVRKQPPDARILKLRDYEDKLQAMQKKCSEQVQCTSTCLSAPMSSDIT